MEFRPATSYEIARLWQDRWGGNVVVSPDAAYRPEDVEGAFAIGSDGTDAALVTWSVSHAEVVSLDGWGAGRPGLQALRYAEQRLREGGVQRARLCTTNDNVGAITLYLRAGYRLVRVHLDAMDEVRKLKPGLPKTGFNGLPLRDVWELEKDLA
jgi:hypothetical protein